MIDHVLGRPSVKSRRLQVLAVLAFWSVYIFKYVLLMLTRWFELLMLMVAAEATVTVPAGYDGCPNSPQKP